MYSRVKYDIFSIRIEFLTTNDLDPGVVVSEWFEIVFHVATSAVQQ